MNIRSHVGSGVYFEASSPQFEAKLCFDTPGTVVCETVTQLGVVRPDARLCYERWFIVSAEYYYVVTLSRAIYPCDSSPAL